MDLTIEIPETIAVVLRAQALAHGISAERFAGQMIEKTLAPALEQADISREPFETGYGMWAKYGPAPSFEEIEENRRDMFSGFGKYSE